MFVPRVPRENNKKCRVCGDDKILGSLTEAGLMSNWLPASKFGGVSESIQELTSYFMICHKAEAQVGRIRHDHPIRMHFFVKAWGHG